MVAWRGGECAMTTVQFVLATALSLVVFVAMANVVVDLYARGVVRAALDEGVRAGAPFDATAGNCAARTREVVRGLLGGQLGRGVRVSCALSAAGEAVEARADVVLGSWLPGVVPDWSFTLTGRATREREP